MSVRGTNKSRLERTSGHIGKNKLPVRRTVKAVKRLKAFKNVLMKNWWIARKDMSSLVCRVLPVSVGKWSCRSLELFTINYC